MSKFLAPIHGWLFNKILLLEDIEKEIILKFKNDSLDKVHEALALEMGGLLPDEPLENLIDQSNIHGWLQKTIITSESRQAAFIKLILEADKNNFEIIKGIYEKKGLEIGQQMNQITRPKEGFDALNTVLLEGMPCDRVNGIIEDGDAKFVWKTQQCVHKDNWENNGVPVGMYYRFREAFSKGFVSNFKGFNYTYEIEDQIHTIITA